MFRVLHDKPKQHSDSVSIKIIASTGSLWFFDRKKRSTVLRFEIRFDMISALLCALTDIPHDRLFVYVKSESDSHLSTLNSQLRLVSYLHCRTPTDAGITYAFDARQVALSLTYSVS